MSFDTPSPSTEEEHIGQELAYFYELYSDCLQFSSLPPDILHQKLSEFSRSIFQLEKREALLEFEECNQYFLIDNEWRRIKITDKILEKNTEKTTEKKILVHEICSDIRKKSSSLIKLYLVNQLNNILTKARKKLHTQASSDIGTQGNSSLTKHTLLFLDVLGNWSNLLKSIVDYGFSISVIFLACSNLQLRVNESCYEFFETYLNNEKNYIFNFLNFILQKILLISPLSSTSSSSSSTTTSSIPSPSVSVFFDDYDINFVPTSSTTYSTTYSTTPTSTNLKSSSSLPTTPNISVEKLDYIINQLNNMKKFLIIHYNFLFKLFHHYFLLPCCCLTPEELLPDVLEEQVDPYEVLSHGILPLTPALYSSISFSSSGTISGASTPPASNNLKNILCSTSAATAASSSTSSSTSSSSFSKNPINSLSQYVLLDQNTLKKWKKLDLSYVILEKNYLKLCLETAWSTNLLFKTQENIYLPYLLEDSVYLFDKIMLRLIEMKSFYCLNEILLFFYSKFNELFTILKFSLIFKSCSEKLSLNPYYLEQILAQILKKNVQIRTTHSSSSSLSPATTSSSLATTTSSTSLDDNSLGLNIVMNEGISVLTSFLGGWASSPTASSANSSSSFSTSSTSHPSTSSTTTPLSTTNLIPLPSPKPLSLPWTILWTQYSLSKYEKNLIQEKEGLEIYDRIVQLNSFSSFSMSLSSILDTLEGVVHTDDPCLSLIPSPFEDTEDQRDSIEVYQENKSILFEKYKSLHDLSGTVESYLYDRIRYLAYRPFYSLLFNHQVPLSRKEMKGIKHFHHFLNRDFEISLEQLESEGQFSLLTLSLWEIIQDSPLPEQFKLNPLNIKNTNELLKTTTSTSSSSTSTSTSSSSSNSSLFSTFFNDILDSINNLDKENDKKTLFVFNEYVSLFYLGALAQAVCDCMALLISKAKFNEWGAQLFYLEVTSLSKYFNNLYHKSTITSMKLTKIPSIENSRHPLDYFFIKETFAPILLASNLLNLSNPSEILRYKLSKNIIENEEMLRNLLRRRVDFSKEAINRVKINLV